jgi:hypothetical protein
MHMLAEDSDAATASLIDAGDINVPEFISSSLVSAVDVSSLKPATGHTQSWWGPPDPYLSAGRSIMPSTKALSEMNIERTPNTENWPPEVVELAKRGTHVLDSAAIQSHSMLPGFAPPEGILPHHSTIPAETPATFAAQVQWSADFLNVVDKLPEAVFAYALVEFFILRPGIDRYKEDIEEEPGRAFAETIAVSGVRLGMFCLVAIVTTAIFA